MKCCVYCGKEIEDNDAIYCPYCGNKTDDIKDFNETSYNYGSSTQTAAKIFMIIGCVATVLNAFLNSVNIFNAFTINYVTFIVSLIPLIWKIPMTVFYFKATNHSRYTSTAFKVCTLLFVNLIAGILMLCDKSDNY